MVSVPASHIYVRHLSDPGGFDTVTHIKSLRANMDPLPVLDALVPVVAALPQAVLRIDVHDEISTPVITGMRPGWGRR